PAKPAQTPAKPAQTPAKPTQTSAKPAQTPAAAATPAATVAPPAQSAQPVPAGDGEIIYKVQFMTSTVQFRDGAPEYKGLKSVSSYKEGNLYKYTCGESTTKAGLQQTLNEVRNLFKDAFIVSFQNGVRIK
ncbi:MAG: hypothetical protein J1E02_05180, partial [Coprobacter sp.]|nr:hypothetical protein [Coprobacter sp.]